MSYIKKVTSIKLQGQLTKIVHIKNDNMMMFHFLSTFKQWKYQPAALPCKFIQYFSEAFFLITEAFVQLHFCVLCTFLSVTHEYLDSGTPADIEFA